MPQNYKKAVWLIIILLCVVPTFAKDKQKRIALVIGNGSYRGISYSTNPGKDVSTLAAVLTELGFEVVQGTNQNKQQTESLIEDFGKKLVETKEIGLIYYSGMGFQSNGENFLVPADASFTNINETIKTSVSLNLILSKLKAAKNKQNLIFLDPILQTPIRFIKGQVIDSIRNGFAKVSLPAKTIVFYSSETGKTAIEKCGLNGYFAGALLTQLEKPKLEFKELAKNVSDEVSQQSNNQQKPFVDGVSKNKLFLVDKKHRLNLKDKYSLGPMFENFKVLIKCRCGEREDAIAQGKTIIEKYEKDYVNQEVIEFIKKRIQTVEKEEPTCFRNNHYDRAYKEKNWVEFFITSKQIIEEEGNSPLTIDVMLTAVSVGFSRATFDKNDAYNEQTLNYAKTVLQRIEAGGGSKTGRWGVFEPFNTKEEAKCWMNNIIGWEMYYKLNQKREALAYFYKSTQISSEKKNDVSIYTNIGNYYFEEYQRFYNDYLEKYKAGNNKETDETKMNLGLARGNAERAIDAFGRAYKILSADKKAKPDAKNAISKTLNNLYKFRFNLEEVNQDVVDNYTAYLIAGPMPDPTTRVELILR